MNELYEAIEKKIKASGYPRAISGADVYDDICDQIEDKENGTYLLLSKFEEDDYKQVIDGLMSKSDGKLNNIIDALSFLMKILENIIKEKTCFLSMNTIPYLLKHM